jgi:hypothetical protein
MMNFLTISQLKPIPMDILYNDDLYVIVEVTLDGVVTSAPMKRDELVENLMAKYSDVKIKNLNETGRLKIVHLKTGTWKQLKLTLDLV